MTGAPPYNPHSPIQQPRYPVYSPPNKNPHPFYPGNDQYQQHPPQTPPTFPQHSALSRSPHYAHATPSLPATLPRLNGDPTAAQYQAHSSAPTSQFSLPRPYSGSILSSNGASPYAQSTPSHAPPPPPRLESHSQSPTKRETDSPYSMVGNSAPGYSMMREPPRPASPPKESVCFLFWISLFLPAQYTNKSSLSETNESGRSHVLCEYPLGPY